MPSGGFFMFSLPLPTGDRLQRRQQLRSLGDSERLLSDKVIDIEGLRKAIAIG